MVSENIWSKAECEDVATAGRGFMMVHNLKHSRSLDPKTSIYRDWVERNCSTFALLKSWFKSHVSVSRWYRMSLCWKWVLDLQLRILLSVALKTLSDLKKKKICLQCLLLLNLVWGYLDLWDVLWCRCSQDGTFTCTVMLRVSSVHFVDEDGDKK